MFFGVSSVACGGTVFTTSGSMWRRRGQVHVPRIGEEEV